MAVGFAETLYRFIVLPSSTLAVPSTPSRAMPARRIVAVDVETTGLGGDDRIVSLGAWRIGPHDASPRVEDHLHLVFNPGRASHPMARRVHGYDDATLAGQDDFSVWADAVVDFVADADIVVAHNASFDQSFIRREIKRAGRTPISAPFFCTMDAYRATGATGRASLSAVCSGIGLERAGKVHGAAEDAWLALMVYRWLHGARVEPLRSIVEKLGITAGPTNLRGSVASAPASNIKKSIPTRKRLCWTKEQRAALRAGTRDIAILLMAVIRADGEVASEEIDVVANLVKEYRDIMQLPPDPEAEARVVAELVEIEPSKSLVTRAMRAVLADPALVQRVSSWVAKAATSDGLVSAAEHASIAEIRRTFSRISGGRKLRSSDCNGSVK